MSNQRILIADTARGRLTVLVDGTPIRAHSVAVRKVEPDTPADLSRSFMLPQPDEYECVLRFKAGDDGVVFRVVTDQNEELSLDALVLMGEFPPR